MNKCIFLDRDGVLNVDLGEYLYKLEDLVIPEGVAEALHLLKKEGYLLIVITNQAGIARGLYGEKEVNEIHEAIQNACGIQLDALYFSPHHPKYSSESLTRKPDSLLIEKAMARFNIDPKQSWMIGDRERDMQAGYKAGLQTIHIIEEGEISAGNFPAKNLLEAAQIVVRETAKLSR
jgi:D-glycero-D-manno-heptose 1,7-bisphosphate phosphatase